MYVFDTDAFSDYLDGHPRVVRRIVQHLSESLTTTVITVEELVQGWLALARKGRTAMEIGRRSERLAATWNHLANWPVLPLNAAAIERYESLRRLKLNVGASDLKIAAIAMQFKATLVTRNRRDFSRVPGLVHEDWSM